MRYLEYRETKKHGTKDFPFVLYYVTCAHPRYYMPHHWHKEYELIHVLEGRFRLTAGEREYLLSAGDTAFIESGTLHGGAPENCRYACVVFDLEDFLSGRPWTADIYAKLVSCEVHITPFFPAENRAVRGFVEAVCSALAEKYEGYRFTVVGQLYALLGTVFSLKLYTAGPGPSLSQKKKTAQLKAVLSYIATHYSEDITLDDLAGCAGMNSRYFCRAFRSLTHQTPMNYLNYYRIETACELLATSDRTVTDIAVSCGFSDSGYFGKVFKKLKGVPPSFYLRDGGPDGSS